MHGRVPIAKATDFERAPAPDAIDLRHVQDFFWRRWKLIVTTAAVVAAVTFVVLLAVTPQYTATAQVLLDPRKEKIFGADTIVPELSLDTGNVDSQISVIRSTNLLQRVVEKTNLTQDPEFGLPAPPGLFSLLRSLVSVTPLPEAKPATAPTEAIAPDVLRAIGRLRSALDVQRVQRTYVISIAVTSEDPAKAARLANAIADAFIVDKLDARYEAAKRASLWLTERMDALREQVQQSEQAVADFRRKHNLVTAGSDAKVTLSEQQLSELNGKLVTARAETAERRAKYLQAQQVQSQGGNLQAIPDVVRSTVISQFRAQQADVARRTAELASRYNDSHPQVINARAELRNIENSISAEVGRILSNLKNDYDVAKAREDSLQQSLDQMTGQSGLDNEVSIQLRALERLNTANKTLFDNFLSRTKITQEQSTFEEREARVISPAAKPGAPSFPRKTLVLSLALVVGCLIGIGGSVALDMLNAGFTTPKEIEEKLGIPVLASIPLLDDTVLKINGKKVAPATYTHLKPLSRYAESIRALRMGVRMANVDNPAKVVLVTSSIQQEGKSTISASLAYSAAQANERVVLIDGDLRHPSATRFFGLSDEPGLVDMLTGAVAMEDVLFKLDGITVIPAGAKSNNPPDLLGSIRMKSLIEKLREHFDYIVIDTPPVGPVIDARVAMQLADKVIYVVRWQSTTREMVAQSLATLDADRKLAGIAFDHVDESKTPRYGPYSYYSSRYYTKYYEG
ncbi:MAG TPA: polysaccharide biosynthesis tyrosine autokinase [Candidatus Acidoferrales bacterium]|nr:polysaccharide biosynthesis tyrosine autokinase [Candidatus Acidoferrales bacterium]